MVRAEVEEALAPLRDRLDELERTMLETIVRLASPTSTASPPPRVALAPPSEDAASVYAAQSGDRRRRRVILALGGAVVIGLGALFALLASCS
jgi:hypothetical protein